MTADDRLDPALVAALYLDHADELRRMLVGVLRDPQLAADALQRTFARCLEVGHSSQAESRKSWLFRVAYREALGLRRREATGERALRTAAAERPSMLPSAEGPLVRWEQVAAVRAALAELPPEQLAVVRLRVYEEQTFAEIAAGLGIPLGTALSRMRAALAKLRERLQSIV